MLGGDWTEVVRGEGLRFRFLRRDLGVLVLMKEVENDEERIFLKGFELGSWRFWQRTNRQAMDACGGRPVVERLRAVIGRVPGG